MPLIVLNSGAAQAYSYQENAMPSGRRDAGPLWPGTAQGDPLHYRKHAARSLPGLSQPYRVVTQFTTACSSHLALLGLARSGEVWRRPDTRPGRAMRQGPRRPFERSRSDLGQRHRPQARPGAMSAALSQEPSYYFNTGLHAMALGALDQHLQRGNVSHCSRRIPAYAQPHGQSAAASSAIRSLTWAIRSLIGQREYVPTVTLSTAQSVI
jgi:hypothetical protein